MPPGAKSEIVDPLQQSLQMLRAIDDFVGLLGTAGSKNNDHRRLVLGVSEGLPLGPQRNYGRRSTT